MILVSSGKKDDPAGTAKIPRPEDVKSDRFSHILV
jgi:hypothetical protein